MQLKGKTAFIAGAGRNNGRAIALTFAREGAELVLVARKRGDELNAVAKECVSLGAKVLTMMADVTQPDEVDRSVKAALAKFQKVDVLVNVLGIRPHKPFWEFTNDEWQLAFAVNLHAAFYLSRALAPGMMQRRSGSIIALGGIASLSPQPEGAAVVTSKHGLYGFIKSIALELGPYGIRANLLALSTIANERLNLEMYGKTNEPDPDAALIPQIPLGRKGTRQEAANVALFLASDASSYITGDRIVCAGGRYM